MEIHPITEPIKSLKEFGVHYLLIVLGIGTAFALEHWREKRKQRAQAREACAAIDAELRTNLENLQRSEQGVRAGAEQLTSLQQRLGSDTFAVPDLAERASALVREESGRLEFGFSLPVLRRAAWDAAVASHALQHVSGPRVAKYSRAYAASDEVCDLARRLVLSERQFEIGNTIDMFERGESKDALRFARSLREFGQTLEMVATNYRKLAETLQETV
jgi:hypothetical protein